MAADAREASFRTTLGFALGMLLIQFLLGMAVNLFVTVPSNHPGANPPEYFGGVVSSVTWAILRGGLWLTLHAAWGLILVLGALGTLVQAIRVSVAAAVSRSPSWGSLVCLAPASPAGAF